MKIAVKIFAVCAIICSACTAIGETEMVEGLAWTYTVTNGQATVGGGSSSSTAVAKATTGAITIPSTLGGCPVTKIDSYAFYQCGLLTSVSVNKGVTSIGRSAFSGCSELTSVTIPLGVSKIGDYAFFKCTGLASMTMPPSVTSIGSDAFYGCTGLKNVTISSGVTHIENYAFYNCSGLMSVTIPSSVTSIGDSAFQSCLALAGVTIPSSVTNIGNRAFAVCNGLTIVAIPSGVTSIGDFAFSSCSGLTDVMIPSSVISVGDRAFAWCSVLTNVVFRGDAPAVGLANPFMSVANGCTATVYEGTADWDDDGDGKWFGLELRWMERKPKGGPYKETVDGIEWAFTVDADLNASIAAISASTSGSITVPTELGGRPVTRINAWAFQSCGLLNQVTVPSDIVEIGVGAFANCNSLTNLTFLGETPPKVPSDDPIIVGSSWEEVETYDSSYCKRRTIYWTLQRDTIFGTKILEKSEDEEKYYWDWDFYDARQPLAIATHAA